MSRLLNQLFEVTELFKMQTRPELILLQKTMVVVEGVARTLDPELDMWQTSEPVVGDWIARNLGPRGQIEAGLGELRAAVAVLPRLPGLVERLDSHLAAPPPPRQARWPLLLPLWIGALALAALALRLIS